MRIEKYTNCPHCGKTIILEMEPDIRIMETKKCPVNLK